MVVDGIRVQSPVQAAAEPTSLPDLSDQTLAEDTRNDVEGNNKPVESVGATQQSRQTTAKMMEELMEELINFQERFGPGAKGRAKDRVISRTMAVCA